jgi:hypothetical protein
MNNKLSFINGPDKPKPNNLDLESKVKQNLDNYLKFIDCVSLIRDTSSLIFGGAVRDAIANFQIHDVDIVVLPEAGRKISSTLEKIGFKIFRKYNMDIATLYSNSIINEPITWYKENIFVQLIRPRGANCNIKTLETLVEQVDISCCGVSFSPAWALPLKEHIDGAIDDCLFHRFRIIKNSTLYNEERILQRCAKLESRSWKQYASPEDISIPF